MYEYFACLYVNVPCVCLVFMEARRVCWIPLELELRCILTTMWVLGSPAEEWPALRC